MSLAVDPQGAYPAGPDPWNGREPPVKLRGGKEGEHLDEAPGTPYDNL
jgi:hypothetical protein